MGKRKFSLYYLKSFKSFISAKAFYGFCKQAFAIKINYRDSLASSFLCVLCHRLDSAVCICIFLFLLFDKIHFLFWLIFSLRLNVTKINKRRCRKRSSSCCSGWANHPRNSGNGHLKLCYKFTMTTVIKALSFQQASVDLIPYLNCAVIHRLMLSLACRSILRSSQKTEENFFAIII